MSSHVKVIIGILVGTALLIGGLVYFGSKSIPSKLGVTEPEGEAQLLRDYHPSIGAGDDAAVTIVEFADLQCPACAAAAPVLREVSKDEGVRLVFRHFPLDQHLNAETGAKAVEAANQQGKFWEMYDMLYERQVDWSNMSIEDATTQLEDYAAELGLDVDQFKKDRDNSDLHEHIKLDKGEGLALEVSATPTIFINGELYEGPRDLESLRAAVDAAR